MLFGLVCTCFIINALDLEVRHAALLQLVVSVIIAKLAG